MMTRSEGEVLAILTLCATLMACGDGGDRTPGDVVVTDSAGVTIATNQGRGLWLAGEGWHLEEELRIGVTSGDPRLQFGVVSGLDVDDEGRIHLLDGQAREVRIFDAAGEFVRSFGESGEGPGEFSPTVAQPPGGLFVGADGTIIVPDLGNQRLARFGPDGTVLESPRLSLGSGIPFAWTRGADRTLFRQRRTLDLPGMASDSVEPIDRIIRGDGVSGEEELVLELASGTTLSFEGGGGIPEIRIFAPEPVWTVLSDGRLVTGSNDAYSLALHDADGEVTMIVRREIERRPVTPGDERNLREIFAEGWEEAGVPPGEIMDQLMSAIRFEPMWPALAQLIAGPDGSLWVQRVSTEASLDEFTAEDLQAGRFGSSAWDVFDADGSYLGVVEMPARFTPTRFVGDHLYGVHRDEMEVQRVVRLRLVR
ncbi:MAG: hypothetical protein RQ745_00060 [Longimicrobiales bacterium]|nr:hypothetical protein [Longimicrobiales bacterium]